MTRREREQRKQRYEAAKALAVREATHFASPRRFDIHFLEELRARGDLTEVLLYCRVSTRHQDLQAQIRGARRRLAKLGIKVRVVCAGIESGKTFDPAQRPVLMQAIHAARRLSIPLVVACPSRLGRASDYHAHQNPDARPSAVDWEAFVKLARDVTIVTLANPDNTPLEDEEFLRRLAAEVQGKPVGRPRQRNAGYARARRSRWLCQVWQWSDEGWSVREIADQITRLDGATIDAATVSRWAAD